MNWFLYDRDLRHERNMANTFLTQRNQQNNLQPQSTTWVLCDSNTNVNELSNKQKRHKVENSDDKGNTVTEVF